MEALRNTATTAEQRVAEAQAAAERVAAELRDYKVRLSIVSGQVVQDLYYEWSYLLGGRLRLLS